MTKQERMKAFEMRIDGCNWTQIGRALGYASTTVQQDLMGCIMAKPRQVNCVYPAIKRVIVEEYSRLIANLRKGDRILCAGAVESREYNGKTYTDMLVDFLMTSDTIPAASAPAENRAALTQRMDSAGFAEITPEEDAELPF